MRTMKEQKLIDVCENIFAGGDVPKERFSKVKSGKYQIPIFANGITDKGLYGYTDTPRVTEPCLTVSARGTIGYTEIRNQPFLPVVRLIVLIPKSCLELKFLKYCLDTLKIRNTGTSIPQLTVPMLKNITIKVPPLSEQKQIVEILDKAFSAIDHAKANIEKNIENARELFQSKLNEIFSQKGEGWEEATLGELGKVSMCKRIYKKQTSSEGDIPFYKIGTFGKIPDAYISKETYHELKKQYSFPKKGEILISASGTIGRRVIYDGEPAYFQDSNIVWLDHNEELVTNEYLYQFFGVCDWNPSKGATISRLYNDNLRRISISFPGLDEQNKLVKIMVELNRQTQDLIGHYQQKANSLVELKKSILHKAFAGELT